MVRVALWGVVTGAAVFVAWCALWPMVERWNRGGKR
jgi:hypothetical protein